MAFCFRALWIVFVRSGVFESLKVTFIRGGVMQWVYVILIVLMERVTPPHLLNSEISTEVDKMDINTHWPL